MAGDDHQDQLAAELARRGLAVVREPEELSAEDLLGTLRVAARCVERPPPIVLRG